MFVEWETKTYLVYYSTRVAEIRSLSLTHTHTEIKLMSDLNGFNNFHHI